MKNAPAGLLGRFSHFNQWFTFLFAVSYTYFKRKRSLETHRNDDSLNRVIGKRALGGFLNNAKWVKLLHALVAHHSLIKECQVKLIWEEEPTGRRLRIDEYTDYQFDYYDQAMEAMISGNPRGWYAYREIEWLEFPRYLTDQAGAQDLDAIQSALAPIGQLPLLLTTRFHPLAGI
ncbi:hypothetical protein [Hymenobacter negativus]|uniref:Uncharacterized protein n=1 Tax=Hymenobacter negativus TaxID=2795026 RepID=A0ABS3QJS9_9BACT|nr:hypothetical protein [Hymenobacter negativus]MBO2011019.1 hypothetical protein [Hymenobacter negativus]